MAEPHGLPPGTLDILILTAVSLGELHGYGVHLRIAQITLGALEIQQGALYLALYRLEHRGLIRGEWGTSANNRRAKFYQLTRSRRRPLGVQETGWYRLVQAMATALTDTPQEI